MYLIMSLIKLMFWCCHAVKNYFSSKQQLGEFFHNQDSTLVLVFAWSFTSTKPQVQRVPNLFKLAGLWHWLQKAQPSAVLHRTKPGSPKVILKDVNVQSQKNPQNKTKQLSRKEHRLNELPRILVLKHYTCIPLSGDISYYYTWQSQCTS